ncbi:MAG: hypothetical protein IAE84_19870 [Saprospiraceae bacterium]|jgi:hypothetical protein|nr:hypothetical protein [Saprospiraceae bacterium]HRD82250.1 hypothetical protein [Saprospiraceae bacterium]
MKYFLPVFVALISVATPAFAQSYFTAGGLRMGTDWGLTLQQRVAKKTSVELILQTNFRRKEGMFTLLGEQHIPLISKRFNLYYGGGIHKGWYTEKPLYGVDEPEISGPFGITAIGGAELTIGRLNLSYDVKPALNISGGSNVIYLQSGVSARYVIAKKPFWEEQKKASKKRHKKKKTSRNKLRLW